MRAPRNPYVMKVVSGSLPPGLVLGEPICEWTIAGTPTHAGTYAFTVQITPQPDNLGQSAGPSGTQQFTVTIGTGTSDRLHLAGATWFPRTVNKYLQTVGFDANAGATYRVYVTSTGKEIGTFTESASRDDGSFLSQLLRVTQGRDSQRDESGNHHCEGQPRRVRHDRTDRKPHGQVNPRYTRTRGRLPDLRQPPAAAGPRAQGPGS